MAGNGPSLKKVQAQLTLSMNEKHIFLKVTMFERSLQTSGWVVGLDLRMTKLFTGTFSGMGFLFSS